MQTGPTDPMNSAIQKLNSLSRDLAIAMLEPLVERSAWVAAQAADGRPFADSAELAVTLVDLILASGREKQLELFRAHPELAGREAEEGRMTDASVSEQARLGLLDLTPADAARLNSMNAAYRTRFGHPFIIALHRVPDLGTLFEIFERRLSSTAIEEHTATLAEISSVIQSRTRQAFGPDPKSSPKPEPANQEQLS